MSFSVTKVDIWSSKIEDKPGSLARSWGCLETPAQTSTVSSRDAMRRSP